MALKRVRFDRSRDGVPVTSVRELRVLQACHHPNIVQLKKVVTGSQADRCGGFMCCRYQGKGKRHGGRGNGEL